MKWPILLLLVSVTFRLGNEYYPPPIPGHENDAVMRYPEVVWGEPRKKEFESLKEALEYFGNIKFYRVEIISARESNGKD